MPDEPIERIRKRFRREWLLIHPTRLDPATQTPLRGRLLAHSARKDEIYSRMARTRRLTFVIHSDKRLPQGYAVAFCA